MTTQICRNCRFATDHAKGKRGGEWINGALVGGEAVEIGLCHGGPPSFVSPNSTGFPTVSLDIDWCGAFQPVPRKPLKGKRK